MSFTNASLATRLGLKCSFDYAVKDDTDDSEESYVITFEWHWVMWTNLLLAIFVSAVAVRLHRRGRKVADQYMAATSGQRRGRVMKKHRKLRKVVINATIVCFILVGLYGSAALFGMTLQSFWAVNVVFRVLLMLSCIVNFVLLFMFRLDIHSCYVVR